MVLAQMVLQLWIPAFGNESHQSHLNPLCDSSANISSEDNAARVTRSCGKHEFCQFRKGERCKRLTVLSTVVRVVCTNKALLVHTEERWWSREKALKCAFELRDELKCF